MKYTEFKVGMKVTVDECYLIDESTENTDTSDTATVRTEPSDGEELVQIEYKSGTLDHVPQNILEPVTDPYHNEIDITRTIGVGVFDPNNDDRIPVNGMKSFPMHVSPVQGSFGNKEVAPDFVGTYHAEGSFICVLDDSGIEYKVSINDMLNLVYEAHKKRLAQ